jgi:SAM-dependent methyltransferase
MAGAPTDLRDFYEDSYARSGEQAAEAERWRRFSAAAKADHVLALAPGGLPAGARVLDIGCGDGVLLEVLHARRPGWRLAGVEIAEAAVRIARDRVPYAAVELYDGAALPFEDAAFDLGVLSHVVEHVADPVAVLRESARACRALVVEVPLEDNVSARRPSNDATRAAAGHIQRFSARGLRTLAAQAGLVITGELSDPLGRRAHGFFARDARARARADAKWLVRAVTHRAVPPLARRLFTVHYAVGLQAAAPASPRS